MRGDCGYDMREGEENFFAKKFSSPSRALPRFSKNTGRGYRWKFFPSCMEVLEDFQETFFKKLLRWVQGGAPRGTESPARRILSTRARVCVYNKGRICDLCN